MYKSFETLLLPDENLGLNKNLEKFEKGSVLIKYVLGPGFNKFGLKNFVDRILDNIIVSNYLVEDLGELASTSRDSGFGELVGRR